MPPPPTREHCYRHPDIETGVHCTRCGRPICPDCMIPAPVGHQCPECVAEARREYRRGPGRQVAVANVKTMSVTKLLLAAMVIGYVWELIVAGGPGSLFQGPSGQALIDAGALVPYSGGTISQPIGGIVGGEYWRLLTSIFLHAGLIHLALNGYILWIFGTTMEQDIGRVSTLAVFLVTGVFAAATSFAFAPGFVIGVGASGAIFGLVGAFVAHSYLRRSNLLAQARLRSALSLLLINLVFGIVAQGMIDWRAHVGGFVAGIVAGFVVDPSRPPAIRRIVAVTGLVGLLVAAAAMVAFRSSQISADPSILFAS
jgi:membrane associated rhomboid family serine protease